MGFAAIGLLFTGVATGLSVYSQMQQGKTAERVAEYNNASAQREATNKELEFSEGAQRAQLNQVRASGAMRAQLASSGVDSATGTPLAILGDTAGHFQTGLNDAARATAMQATAMRQTGAMALWQGQNQKQAANIGAIASGLKGIGDMGSTFGHNQYSGAFA